MLVVFSSARCRVVCAPSRGDFISRQISGFSTKMSTCIFQVMYLVSSVLTTPGCRETVIPLSPASSIFFCSSRVKRMLAPLVRPQASPAWYPLVKFMSSKSIEGLCLWAPELTLITRNSSAFFSFSQSSAVKQKCPKWLVPICISQPSTVTLRSGMAITPALLMSMSIFSTYPFTLSENSLMEALSARSKGKQKILAFLFSLSISLMASSDLRASLAPKQMVHGLLASTRMVYLPMPVLAPVMTTTWLMRSRVALHLPPLAQSLRAVRRTREEERAMVPVVVRAQLLRLLKYSMNIAEQLSDLIQNLKNSQNKSAHSELLPVAVWIGLAEVIAMGQDW